MEPAAQAPVPGYYVWQPEGARLAVHLRLDVIDRMGPEIMKGFGAVPKRGAEVGGILLGSILEGAMPVVRIDDFEVVACHYKRGPSFLLTEDDGKEFDETCRRAAGPRAPYGVGYFRSHTRDGEGLGADDQELLEKHFAGANQIALVVRPFATKPSLANFYLRNGGQFDPEIKREFPFRRFNLTGEEAPRRRPLGERRPRAERLPDPAALRTPVVEKQEPELFKSIAPAPRKSRLGGWVWIPVSLLFLGIGILLGFQSALTLAPRVKVGAESDYRLSLAATRTDDNLTVRWNRDAPILRSAARGSLEIEDGGFSKSVDLDYASLQSGSIIYRNTADSVRFRLVVFLSANLSIAESLDWSR